MEWDLVDLATYFRLHLQHDSVELDVVTLERAAQASHPTADDDGLVVFFGSDRRGAHGTEPIGLATRSQLMLTVTFRRRPPS
jgi:hypothetical protein